MMMRLGIIGGTGAADIIPDHARHGEPQETPWGVSSAPLLEWTQGAARVGYLARHGLDADTAPHLVNYRANVWALREWGADVVIGLNAVGGISSAAWPGRIVVPHQLIDYTWGRAHTYCDGILQPLRHVEFDPPFASEARDRLLQIASSIGVDCLGEATYGVTQGPRLETAAEIDRLAADGCDVVGMTAMPEAALAREAGVRYAICAIVVNRAAGRLPPGSSIHGQLATFLAQGMRQAGRLIEALCGPDG